MGCRSLAPDAFPCGADGQTCVSDFVERLPWRVAALAGLLVGAMSLLGGTDLWATLLRVGAAFAIFGLLGWGLRSLLQSVPSNPAPPSNPPGPDSAGQGAHVDQTIPEMTVEDLQSAEGKGAAPPAADEPRR